MEKEITGCRRPPGKRIFLHYYTGVLCSAGHKKESGNSLVFLTKTYTHFTSTFCAEHFAHKALASSRGTLPGSNTCVGALLLAVSSPLLKAESSLSAPVAVLASAASPH